MVAEDIVIKGAKVHNLKNVSLRIPRNKLVVFTGLSGSGKSSLAFDTIYAEGQRRYVESLSAYARQFLEMMEKPDVEYIAGLSPAVSIDQKTTNRNPRSTVGTVTEIYDYLRVLFTNIGKPHCPQCHQPINKQSIQQILEQLLSYPLGTKLQLLAPVIRARKGEYKALVANIKKEGFVRLRVDGQTKSIDDELDLDKKKKHSIEIVIDRLIINQENKGRIFDSLETALRFGEGLVIALLEEEATSQELFFSEHLACTACNINLAEFSIFSLANF